MSRWRAFPLQLLFFTILPLTVLVLSIAFVSLFLHQRAMRSMVGERDERAVRAAAAAIEEQLFHRASAIRSLSLRTGNTTPDHILDDATFLLPDYDVGIALFDPELRLVATTNEALGWEEMVTGSLESLNFQDEEATFFAVPQLTSAAYPLIFVAAEEPTGLIAVGAFTPARIAESALANLFSPTDEQAAAFLTDENGRLLFQMGDFHEQGSDLSQYFGVYEAIQGESGTAYLTESGQEQVIAYSGVAPVNWALVIKEPWETVADPLLRLTEFAPIILAPLLIFALIGLWFGLKQIVTPLQSLEKQATALGWGDFEAIQAPVGGIYEIQRLQTELIHMADKVKLAQQNLRGYLGAVTVGQEEERRRLARDLHDETIQALIALNQRLQMAQLEPSSADKQSQLHQMQQMTTQIITSLRRLTHDLRPIYLEDLGLVAALEMLARDNQQKSNLSIQFHSSGIERRLDTQAELALYRMSQEGITNIIRHAQAKTAELRLDFNEEGVVLTIKDDGTGFRLPESPADMANGSHFGLLGIQERCELIEAQFMLESELNRGTCITIVLPTQGEDDGW